ncbi:acyltransferase family protein [Acinetobacter tandoii]|nr:acyltransferase family protein [Acinetobacter tandoii]
MDNFVPPNENYGKWGRNLERWYFDPVFLNTDQLDMSKPALFVGNHTLYGLLDVPLILEHLREKHGIHLRSLGDRMHFYVPLWKDILTKGGMVLGTPENCHKLMLSGQSIIVFPGGAREVMRRKGERYQLIWKKRAGFARLAIEHGYDIIPFASVGADDCFDIVLDANDIQKNTMAQKFLKKFKLNNKLRDGDILPPLSTGIGYLPIPMPQRFYFSFGDRISTLDVENDDHGIWSIREKVSQSIEKQISELKEYRLIDKKQNWSWVRKKLTKSFDE